MSLFPINTLPQPQLHAHRRHTLHWTSGLWIKWRQFRSLLTVLNVCHSVVTDCEILKAAWLGYPWLGYPSKARNFHINFRENCSIIAIVEMAGLTQRDGMVNP